MASAGGVKVEPLGHRENDGDVEFIWGKKRGKGGKSKEVQFYESFTYDGVEYALYDCVYMHKEGVHPCIGKLIKIWENPDKSRKVKVHWFFRPPEILYYLKDVKVGENEIFLASGEGTGLANVNPLEAVAGKCNVVCISEDERNPQLSEEEIKMADYVFYRAFDVGKCAISVKMDDKIGGLDVTCVFNRKESRKASEVLKIASDQNGDRNAAELKPHNSLETVKSAERGTNILDVKQESAENGNSKAAQKSSNLVGKIDADLAGSPVRQDPLHADANDSRIVQQSTMKQNPAPAQVVNSPTTTTVSKKNVSSEENDHKTPKDDKQVSKRSDNMVKTGEKGKTAKDAGTLDDRPSKRIKVNGSVKNSEDKGESSLKNDEKVPGTSAILSEERRKSGDNKLSGGLDKNKKIRKDGGASSDRPLKRANIDNLKVTEDRDKSSMSANKQDDNKLPKLSALSPKDVERTQGKSFGTSPREVERAQGKSFGTSSKEVESKEVERAQGKSFGTSSKEVERTLGKSFEVTPRPVTESSKWFKAPPWEEVMQTSNEQGSLILVENLNLDYTSGEVEDIIWHACKENCTAKMVQRTAFSSPHSGRAFVAFKTREAAERVMKKLEDGCLMMSNQRPLVASFVTLPETEGNGPSFAGHLCVDKLKLQLQREMKEAVSTSHCSQPNTIEYEMALEWRLLQTRSDTWGSRLYKQHKEEVRKIASGLKRK